MQRTPDRSSFPRDTATFLICAGLSILALYGPTSWGLAIASAIRQTGLVPFVWLQARAEEANTSRARFRAVQAQRDSAAMALQYMALLQRENANLRGLMGLSQRIGMRYVPAEVLHQAQATDPRTLLLSAGTGAGVAPFDPVVSPDGLVGVVRAAERTQSLALTWAHPDFRVSAFAADGHTSGIVAAAAAMPDGEALLELRSANLRDTLPPGTLILSSGLGGVFPRGIPIGRVIGLSPTGEGWERRYLLQPAADPATVSHVLVLLSPRDSVARAAFLPDSTP
ncbi:MAG: rod shape-determining protein MreC [Gemmatimonadota bacterium]